MATVSSFNTLGFAKFLTENGFDKKQAEALAEAYYEFQINDLATKEFVHSENEKIRHEITASENRMMRVNGALIAFAVAAIPIIVAILQRLLPA